MLNINTYIKRFSEFGRDTYSENESILWILSLPLFYIVGRMIGMMAS